MEYPNMISTTISDKEMRDIIGAINFIDNKLPDLVTLSDEEISALPQMCNDTIGFVLENLKKAEKNTHLVPNNIDLKEVKKDVELIKAIYKILEPLNQLKKKLEDSALLAGSEAYLPSIAIHNAMRADVIRQKRNADKVTS